MELITFERWAVIRYNLGGGPRANTDSRLGMTLLADIEVRISTSGNLE